MNNKYYIIRHGEALSNVSNIISSWKEKIRNPLTEKGREQAKKAGELLERENITKIFSSDVLRARETAEIIGNELNVRPEYDSRLREYNVGVYSGKPIEYFTKEFGSQIERFEKRPEKGETYEDIKKRMKDFMNNMEKKYNGENIVMVSHQVPIILLLGVMEELSNEMIFEKYLEKDRINNGEIVEIPA